ncbi:MAG: hypothetical protein HYY64_13160 [Candidatus Rokubacteria bacterium]|nr:hypothetical protein [Candidatus Rokubacteria bacterium]
MRVVSAWATPVLLLAVPTALMVEGRDGLWLGFLFVVAPLFASLATPERTAAAAGFQSFPAVLGLLVVSVIVWANLSLAGDVATWLGWPRWLGVVPAALAAGVSGVWPRASRAWLWLVPIGLVALLLPMAAMVRTSGSNPLAIWTDVASQPAFRFSPESPWVTEGRAVGPRRGLVLLAFDEEHRLTPADPRPLRVEVNDSGRVQVQEWTLAPGQSVTLRPGDRLQLDGPRRLKFEADKRVPGAPVSGTAWADSSFVPRPLRLLSTLGLGLTLLGGALALAGPAGSARPARAGAVLGGAVLLALLAWAECWAVYAVRWAPELYMGGVNGVAILELPTLVLRGSAWGLLLAGAGVVGLLALFLAGCAALRDRLTEAGGLWAGVLVAAAVLALLPLESWALMLSALGLGASCLAPLILFGPPPARSHAATWALAVGVVLFLGVTAAGKVWPPGGAVAQALVAYPALVAAPAAAAVLRVAGRPARA